MPTPLRVAGALSGAVDVESLETTVGALRAEVSRLLGCSPAAVRLVAGGATLSDDGAALSACRVTAATRVLVLRGGEAATGLRDEEQRLARLERVRASAAALAGRREESDAAHSLVLSNQAGEALQLSDVDRQCITSGVLLHAQGKALLARGAPPAEAASVLVLALEAFDTASPTTLSLVDNAPICALDWCFSLLLAGDTRRLAVAQSRLEAAREGLRRAHGDNRERLRALAGGFSPELAVYARLALLEGVSAALRGDAPAARARLADASAQLARLTVDSPALATLCGLGFGVREATRALRASGGDADAAAERVLAVRAQLAAAAERQAAERAERRELRALGRTPTGTAVSGDALRRVSSMGFDRALAGEALRVADNVVGAAVDALSDPQRSDALAAALAGRAAAAERRAAELGRLAELGFSPKDARRGLAAGRDASAAADWLLSAAAKRSRGDGHQPVDGDDDDDEEAAAPVDEEMETELARAVRADDPLRAYDVDVSNETALVREWLARLDAA